MSTSIDRKINKRNVEALLEELMARCEAAGYEKAQIEFAEARKDAERYRWLRDANHKTELVVFSRGTDLDAAIDAAIASAKEPKA